MPNKNNSDMLNYWKQARQEINNPKPKPTPKPKQPSTYRSSRRSTVSSYDLKRFESVTRQPPKRKVEPVVNKTFKEKILDYIKANKKIRIALIVIGILLILTFIDFIVFYGKVYPGVHVGELDLSFKTIEEAQTLIEDTYKPRLESNSVIVYVDEEAKEKGMHDEGGSGLNEQLSVEQAKKSVQYWRIGSKELDAKLPSNKLADEAVNSTRGPLMIFSRLGAMIFGQKIEVKADINEENLHEQIAKINDTIGKKVVDPTVKIENADAVAVDGSDGSEIKDDEFENQVNSAFFKENPDDANFVTQLHPAYQHITYSCAQEIADKINNSLMQPVKFKYNSTTWDVEATELGSWITVSIENRQDENKGGCSCSHDDNNYCIYAKVESANASRSILSHAKGQINNNKTINVEFESNNSGITVIPSDTFDIPAVTETINTLNNDWLKNPVAYKNNANGKNSGVSKPQDETLVINIESTTVPAKLSFDEAMALGIIGEISHYTTTYSSGSGTENRNHNIALVSQNLNNSICKAHGNTWSYNDIAGECNAEKGFKEAGSVYGSTYTKEVGGGICQVATTVFNAVYEAGYSIPIRANHDLHIASYPAGRDAAISWPSPDLLWRNDEDSDVLVKVDTTGYSVTCTLYGVSPNYKVETETGEWTPGDKFKQEVVVDPTKPANSSYIQTSGSDGKSIVVKRKVYNKEGKLVREDEFRSNYKPKTEVRVIGPGKEADELLANKKARMKTDKDNW